MSISVCVYAHMHIGSPATGVIGCCESFLMWVLGTNSGLLQQHTVLLTSKFSL